MHKKYLTTVLSAAILIIICITTDITHAYLTTFTEQKRNEFFQGYLTAMIYENSNQAPDSVNILTVSGTNAIKIVQIKNMPNLREINTYIRIMLVPVFRKDGSSLAGNMSLNPSGNTVSIAAPNGGTITLNLKSGWENNWIYSNGFYYCKRIIHPNELTAALLENITVSNTTLWSTFQLEVLVDSIQAESGTASAVWGSSIAGQLEQP